MRAINCFDADRILTLSFTTAQGYDATTVNQFYNNSSRVQALPGIERVSQRSMHRSVSTLQRCRYRISRGMNPHQERILRW